MYARTQALSRLTYGSRTFRINIHGRFINKEIALQHGSIRKFEKIIHTIDALAYDFRRGRNEIHEVNVFVWLETLAWFTIVKVSRFFFVSLQVLISRFLREREIFIRALIMHVCEGTTSSSRHLDFVY